jgi:choline dehydrogenase
VKHYSDPLRDALDLKFTYKLLNGSMFHGVSPPEDATPMGIYYPRTAALGGCANHNAMIMMRPLDDDWNQISNITGDSSRKASKMRVYQERFEDCQYASHGSPGHGYDGWLSTNRAETSIFMSDKKTYWMLKAAGSLLDMAVGSMAELLTTLSRDLNDGSVEAGTERGLYNAPLSMDRYKRSSPRDFLLAAQRRLEAERGKRRGGKIDLRLNCLAKRIIFAPGTTKAIGVEFLDGSHLYKADPKSGKRRGVPGVAFARKEIILSGGAYNTPQLLMLSGFGASQALERFRIPEVVALQGVGQNLQDRIENSVVADVSAPWTVFEECSSSSGTADPCLLQWLNTRDNTTKYATNGRPVHIPLRSSVSANGHNDLVVTGRPGYFAGYFPGYSSVANDFPKSWTWPVLKAYTTNRDGLVSLRSADPRDPPSINFNYFDEGSGNWTADLEATVQGMQFARQALARYAAYTNSTVTERLPGPRYKTHDELREWVKYNSWGHHACCTSPVGRDGDHMAVLDGRFRVRGTSNLRVVDASVFPRIPGYYIQSSIYTISEKAADVIITQARS